MVVISIWAARRFKLGVERQGFAPNLNVWALRRSIVVHLVACGFSFHISLFPTIAAGTTQPAQCPARDLEKLEWLTRAQTETFTPLILCMWLFNMFIFNIQYIEMFHKHQTSNEVVSVGKFMEWTHGNKPKRAEQCTKEASWVDYWLKTIFFNHW